VSGRPTRPRVVVPEPSAGFHRLSFYLDLRRQAGDERELILRPARGSRYDGVALVPELVEVLRHAAALMADELPVLVSPVSRRLTTTQVAKVLGISRPTLVRLLDEGRIPHERVGNRRYVLAADLAAHQRAVRRQGRRRSAGPATSSSAP
jgi:excisionase family DNA binding protein